MKRIILAALVLVLAACNHLSGEGGLKTTNEYEDNGNGNGGGM